MKAWMSKMRAKLPAWMPGSTQMRVPSIEIDQNFDKLAKVSKRKRRKAIFYKAKSIHLENGCTEQHGIKDQVSLVFFGGIFATLGVLMSLVLAGEISTSSTIFNIVCWTFASLLFSFGRSAAIEGMISGHLEENSRKLRPIPADTIPAYLELRILQERNAVIGRHTYFGKTLDTVDSKLKDARNLRSDLIARISISQHPEPLKQALSELKPVIEKLETHCTALLDHKAKVNAFFNACFAAVDEVRKPLTDLELIKRTQRIASSCQDLETQIIEAIVESTAELAMRVESLDEDHKRLFEQAGIELAVIAPDVKQLAQTVDAYVPAEDKMKT